MQKHTSIYHLLSNLSPLFILIASLAGCASPSAEVITEEHSITLPREPSSGLDGELLIQASNATLIEDPEGVEELAGWQEVNQLVGCLVSVPELGIQEPALCGVEDNSQWLRTNIYGEYAVEGTVCLDWRCDLETSTIKLFHGHNMADGGMFGPLPELLELEDVGEAPIIKLVYPEGAALYQVFAVVSVNSKEEALPINPLATSEENLEVLADLLERSVVPGGEIISGDCVVLNTCWYGESGVERNLHCLVVASRI